MKTNKETFLVLGGAGFIGSNMVDFLIEEGHTVYVIDNLSTGKRENLNPKCNFLEKDLSKKSKIKKLKLLIEDWKIDYVIHMAAVPNVQQSIDSPIETNKNNFQTTLNILEAIRDTNVKKIVFSSTSAIYGNCDIIPTNESSDVNPMSPYALQKLMGEEYIKLYSKLYGIKGVCLRYFNVFGNRMTNEGAYKSVISIFREQKHNNQSLTITNDGNQRRDFVYVGDVVKANYLSCIEDTGDFEIFNVGYGTNISVNEIASYFNQPTTYIGERIEPFETLSSTKKIETVLNWKPTVSVKEFLNEQLCFTESK
jgi:UDP-glucose 4-epimerase